MAVPELQAVFLIEKDVNNEVLWAWSYPGVDGGLRDLLMKKCTLDQEGVGPYTYGHHSQHWYYLRNFLTDGSEQLPKVTSFCIGVLAKEFNPEKYNHLSEIFGQAYLSSGSPVSIVTHFLSVYTKDQTMNVPDSCEPFVVSNYDIRKAYVACSFKDLVREFGVETILIYNALLLKKKVVVYASSIESLLTVCRTLPLLVLHRKNWDIVYPQCELEEMELTDLSQHGTYVAGFTDFTVEGRTDLYDLFINVPEASVSVSPGSKDVFAMTKLHKDIAMRLMESVQDDSLSDQAVIKELSVKTRELINNLSTLVPKGEKLSLDILHARKFTPATENFLFNLATVEGLAAL